jgi:uncharacterized protein
MQNSLPGRTGGPKNRSDFCSRSRSRSNAEHTIRSLVEKYRIEAFMIGDGTAGRETEQFIKKRTWAFLFSQNEDGAGVLCIEIARKNFRPDITVRVL